MALQLRREVSVAPLQQALISSRANPSQQQETRGIASETSQPFRSPRAVSTRAQRGALVSSSSSSAKANASPTPTGGPTTAAGRGPASDSHHQLTRKEVSWLARLYARYREDPTEKENLQRLMWEIDRETMDSQHLDAKLNAVASVNPSPAVTPTSPSQLPASLRGGHHGDGLDEAPPILSFEQLLQYAQSVKMKFDNKLSEEEQMTLDAFVLLGGREDKSGEIQVETLRQCVEEFRLNVDVDAFIAVVDKDGDGTVSYPEFAWLYNQGIFDPGTPAVSAEVMQRNSTRARLIGSDASAGVANAASASAIRMSATVLDSPARRKTAARVRPPGVACKHLHDTDEIAEKLMEVDEVHNARVAFVNRNAKESMTGLVRRLSLVPSAVTQYASFRNISSAPHFGTGRIDDFRSATFAPVADSGSVASRADRGSAVASIKSPRRVRSLAEIVAEKLNASKNQVRRQSERCSESCGVGDVSSRDVQAMRVQWSSAARAVAEQRAVVARHVEQLHDAVATLQQLEQSSREANAALRQALSQARRSNVRSLAHAAGGRSERTSSHASPRDRSVNSVSRDRHGKETAGPETPRTNRDAPGTLPPASALPADDASEYESSDFTVVDTAPQSRSSTPASSPKSASSSRSAASTFTVESSRVVPATTSERHDALSRMDATEVDSKKDPAPSDVVGPSLRGIDGSHSASPRLPIGQRPGSVSAARAAKLPPHPPRATRPLSAARSPALHRYRRGSSMRFVRKFDKSFQELISTRDGPSAALSVTPPAVAVAIKALHNGYNNDDADGITSRDLLVREAGGPTAESLLAEQLEKWTR